MRCGEEGRAGAHVAVGGGRLWPRRRLRGRRAGVPDRGIRQRDTGGQHGALRHPTGGQRRADGPAVARGDQEALNERTGSLLAAPDAWRPWARRPPGGRAACSTCALAPPGSRPPIAVWSRADAQEKGGLAVRSVNANALIWAQTSESGRIWGIMRAHAHPLPSGAARNVRISTSDLHGGGDDGTSQNADRVHAALPDRGGLSAGDLRAPLAARLLLSPLWARACLVPAWPRSLGVRELPLPRLPDRRHDPLLHTHRSAQVVSGDLAVGLHQEGALGGRTRSPARRHRQDHLVDASQDRPCDGSSRGRALAARDRRARRGLHRRQALPPGESRTPPARQDAGHHRGRADAGRWPGPRPPARRCRCQRRQPDCRGAGDDRRRQRRADRRLERLRRPGGAGYGHLPCMLPAGADVDQWLPWSHIVHTCSPTSSVCWTPDVFHGVSPAHLQAYLDEYCDRLNRRDQREDIFRRLLNRCVLYTDPAPYSLLTAT